MKKIVSLMMVICLLLNLVTITTMATRNIKVTVDGKEVTFPDAKPFIDENNRTLIPVRFVAEELGATVKWGHTKKEVYIYYEDVYMMLKIGSNKITIENSKDKTTKDMDTKAIIKANRTYVPIRYVAEGLGATVKWDDGNDTVIIKRKGYVEKPKPKYSNVDDLGIKPVKIDSLGKDFYSYDNDWLSDVYIFSHKDMPMKVAKRCVIHNIKIINHKQYGEMIVLEQEVLDNGSTNGVGFAVKNIGLSSRAGADFMKESLGNNMYRTYHRIYNPGDPHNGQYTTDVITYFVWEDGQNLRRIAIKREEALQ